MQRNMATLEQRQGLGQDHLGGGDQGSSHNQRSGHYVCLIFLAWQDHNTLRSREGALYFTAAHASMQTPGSPP